MASSQSIACRRGYSSASEGMLQSMLIPRLHHVRTMPHCSPKPKIAELWHPQLASWEMFFSRSWPFRHHASLTWLVSRERERRNPPYIRLSAPDGRGTWAHSSATLPFSTSEIITLFCLHSLAVFFDFCFLTLQSPTYFRSRGGEA